MELLPFNTIMAYRDTFLRSQEARDVLKDILNDLCYFNHRLEDDEQRHLHNAAMTIKAKLGIALPEMMDAEIDSFRNILPEPPKEIHDNGR